MQLAERLEGHHRVKIIERDAGRCQYLAKSLIGTIVLRGDAGDADLLWEEDIENTDVFCALTNDEEANILSATLAKRLGVRKTIAIVNSPSYVDLVQDTTIDIAVSPAQVTIGALLDPAIVWQRIEWVALVLAGLVAGKGLLMLVVTRLSGADTPVAFRTAAQLAQAGEFGFVLLTLASANGLLAPEVVQPSLAGMLLSMLAAPFVIERARHWSTKLSRDEWLRHSAALQEVAAHAFGIQDHAIICGYGRTGQSVARFLYKEKIPFIALDMDAHRVQQALTAGENVVFGNAERREVLLAAGLERARIVVVTSPDVPSALKVLGIVRARRPDLPVVVRAADDAHLDELKRAGATEVVPEVMEGSLMLAAQTLTRLGVPLRRVLGDIEEARERRYELLRERYGDAGQAAPEEKP